MVLGGAYRSCDDVIQKITAGRVTLDFCSLFAKYPALNGKKNEIISRFMANIASYITKLQQQGAYVSSTSRGRKRLFFLLLGNLIMSIS